MPRRALPSTYTAAPNLAPMVDVVMVILIFFMLGTTFAVSEGVLPAQIPSQIGPGGGAAVTIIPTVRISLLADQSNGGCRILVMEQEITDGSFAGLGDLLQARREAGAHPASPVLIAAEGAVEYQQVVWAMDACVRAGFSNIQFSVKATAIPADSNVEATR